ncbi:MAG: putative ABC transporter permease [Clostridiales bacterium]|nr:putative ABC transporter permease [Clostridiales bacterium]
MKKTPLYIDRLPYKAQPLKKRLCALSIATVAFSFYGWCLETLLFFIKFHTFCDRGLLTLPFCPMYGLSALGMYFLLSTPLDGFWKKFREKGKTPLSRALRFCLCLLLYAVLTAAIATLTEFITGLFYHKAYGVRLWNYHRKQYNYKGYISLRYSFIWGILAALSMTLVWRSVTHALVRVPENILLPLAVLLSAALIFDFAFNSVYLHRHGRRLIVELLFRRL